MNVLLIHNYYGSSSPSGENQVFEIEKQILEKYGHQVEIFTRNSDEILKKGMLGAFRGGLATPWNPMMAAAVLNKVESFRPDIVHVHNTFPLISPAIFNAIGTKSTTVLTLHNYRLFCAAAIPMRSGKVCTQCLDKKSVLPALWYGCYRQGRLATAPLAVMVALHRFLGTWTKQVDAFITLTEFQRLRMADAGLPEDLVHVKPNFFPGSPDVVPWDERRASVVFAGRLTIEKGVMSLVRAWLMWGASAPELRIVGDGDLRGELELLAGEAPEVPITFLGKLTGPAAQDEIACSRLLVLPSECYEGFPMTLLEAFAFGTPVAVSDIGPLPSIVRKGENGMMFASGNPQSLLETVRGAWESGGELERLAAGARRSFDAFYTEEAHYRMLMAIYHQAMEVSQQRQGGQ